MSSIAPLPSNRTVILAAIDATPASREAAAAAGRFGALPGSEVHFLHVLPPFTGKLDQAVIDRAQGLLESHAQAYGAPNAMLHLAVGKPWREIVQLAADLHADLVVVGTNGRGPLGRMVLGSVAEHVVRKAGCPVHVARAKHFEQNPPEIEPACPACLAVQEKTRGAQLWCEQHSNRHVHGQLHYEFPEGFGAGSAFLRP